GRLGGTGRLPSWPTTSDRPEEGSTVTDADDRPVLLPTNQFPHFYRGGDRIGALRGGPGGPMRPEEWIGSTVTRFGKDRQGLSELSDGRLLRDAVLADPTAWLG